MYYICFMQGRLNALLLLRQGYFDHQKRCTLVSLYILELKGILINVVPVMPEEEQKFLHAFVIAEEYFKKLFNI